MPSQETVERLSQDQREALLGLLPPQFKRRKMRNTVKILDAQPPAAPTFGSIEMGQMFRYPKGETVYLKAQFNGKEFRGVHLATGSSYEVPNDTFVEPVYRINVS
jgi:hypothetical protein